jgi:hypothetical protein
LGQDTVTFESELNPRDGALVDAFRQRLLMLLILHLLEHNSAKRHDRGTPLTENSTHVDKSVLLIWLELLDAQQNLLLPCYTQLNQLVYTESIIS